MHYLIYLSSAVSLMTDDELLSLLQQSREKNRRLEITGMLLYKGGNFMQFLEGEKRVVLELYDTIRADTRHTGVITVMTGDTSKRSFENWSMGFWNMEKAGDLPEYNEYLKHNLALREFQDDAQSARNFMINFNRITK